MPSSFRDLKDLVTQQLGENDGGVPVGIRDSIINQARRQFYSERKWSFLQKSAPITITNGRGPLPADFNLKFDPTDVYYYNGSIKFQLTKVSLADVNSYPVSMPVYAIDRENEEIVTNTGDVTMDYTYLPADKLTDGSQDTDPEPAPDITPIGLLATAKWWLASERGTGKYQLFKDEYETALAMAANSDSGNQPLIPLNNIARRRPRTGYWGL